ncbi:MAG: sensor histidine kinase [Bacteriovoracia bacterium]
MKFDSNTFFYGLVTIISICIVGFFFFQISHYFNWQEAYESNPNVLNLTRSNLSWEANYGNSIQCGEVPCALVGKKNGITVTKKVTLPSREFPLSDLQPGQKIYLSSKIELPKYLLNQKEPLVLYSIFIWAKNYKVFINNRLLTSGGAETLFVVIPENIFQDQETIDIGFEINPGNLAYQGIANRRDLLLGPKSILNSIAFRSNELRTSYYLWFIIPKGFLLLLLSVVYLRFNKYNELLLLILSGSLDLGAETLNSAYSPTALSDIAPIVSEVLLIWSRSVLIHFILTLYRIDPKHRRPFLMVAYGIGLASTIAFFLSKNLGNSLLRLKVIENLEILLHMISSVFGLYFSAKKLIKRDFVEIPTVGKTVERFLFFLFLALTLIHSAFLIGLTPINSFGILSKISSLILFLSFSIIVSVEFAIAIPERDLLKTKLVKRELEIKQVALENEKNKAIALLATQVAHDIKSPLSALRAAAGQSQEAITQDSRNLILSAIDRIGKISNDLLKKYKASIQPINSTSEGSMNVENLVLNCIAEKRATTKKAISIEFTKKNNPPEIITTIEFTALGRAVSNILDNAIEACDAGGKIKVSATYTENHFSISVKDTGRGIPEDVLPKIGTEGFTHGKKEGTGLGLHYVNQLIDRHGGTISIESDGKTWTLVSIELPCLYSSEIN